MGLTCFEKMGLPESSSPVDVKTRWRQLCMTLHPDRGGNAVEFHEMRLAYKEALTEASRPKACLVCNGTGRRTVNNGFVQASLACDACHASGCI